MTSFFDISLIFQRSFLLFFIENVAFVSKCYILFFLGLQASRTAKLSKPLLLLFCVLIGGLFSDFTWMIKLFREIFLPTLDYRIIVFFIRLSWAFSLIQFQALSAFVESLSEKKYKIKVYQKILLFFNSCLVLYFLFLAVLQFDIIIEAERWIEVKVIGFSSVYMFLMLILPSIVALKKLRSVAFPKILKQQLIVLLKYLIFPYILTESAQSFFLISVKNAYLINSLSTSLLTIAICYCIHRIMGLRFLNFQEHVQAPEKFDFIIDFKRVLEDLGHAASFNEMSHIIQGFFKEAFDISPSKTAFYVRKNELMSTTPQETRELTVKEMIVENNLANDEAMLDVMRKSKILIKDEVVFSNFYQETDAFKRIVHFLDELHADVFLPIFENNLLVGYIIIECDARENKFFSDVEHDELVVVASYLGKVINLLYYSTINAVLAREKELSEEVYHQHRQINQYQECISTFMRTDKQRKIGVLFYKYRRFVFANQAAKEIVNINVNMQDGHPLAQALKRVAQEVENYKSTQTVFTHDAQGNRLVLLGIPNLERNNVIVIAYYPEISDVLKYQMDKIGNPTDWHYILCLETTKSGQLINQMIPGSGPHLMRFKIDLLSMALSKKALLLDMPEADVLATAEIVHYISLRKALYHLKVNPGAVMADVSVKLFGINPLYGNGQPKDEQGNVEKPLFEQLHDSGTLFIENVHLLNFEIQNTLAGYIKYGHYCKYKSTHKLFSSVRVICSTNRDLQTLVQEGKFSKELFEELKATKLTLPSFLSLPEEELNELINGLTEQAVSVSPLKNLLELSVHEKMKMFEERPGSLHEFKNKVKNALVKKSQKQEIYHEIKFEAAYTISDPELSEAAKLGKKALKDPKVLAMLLRKLKTQSKVADFLGVNRSSINRRLKQYKLI
jgi:hypothetical protein